MSRFRRHNSVQVQWRRLHARSPQLKRRLDSTESDTISLLSAREMVIRRTPSPSTPKRDPTAHRHHLPSCLHSTIQDCCHCEGSLPPNSMKSDWPCHFLLGRVSPLQMSVHSPPPMLHSPMNKPSKAPSRIPQQPLSISVDHSSKSHWRHRSICTTRRTLANFCPNSNKTEEGHPIHSKCSWDSVLHMTTQQDLDVVPTSPSNFHTRPRSTPKRKRTKYRSNSGH